MAIMTVYVLGFEITKGNLRDIPGHVPLHLPKDGQMLEIRQREHPLHGWKEVSPLPYLTEPPVIPVIHWFATIADMISKEESRLLQLDVGIRCEDRIGHEHPRSPLINMGNHFPANWRPVNSHRYGPSQCKSQTVSAPPTRPKWCILASEPETCGTAKEKDTWSRYFAKNKGRR